MGWKVIIAPSARADLESIVRFIARHNADAAERMGNRWDSSDPGNMGKDSAGEEQWKSRTLPKGVKLHLRHENPMRTIPPAS